MIISGENTKKVIENIKYNVENNLLNEKVMLGDPVVSSEKMNEYLNNFFKIRANKMDFKIKSAPARAIISNEAKKIDPYISIEGMDNLDKFKDQGAIVTSNHFNPYENFAVKKVIKEKFNKDVCTVVMDTNIAMEGSNGYLFNHMNVLPVNKSASYMTKVFKPELKKRLDNGEYVLIYPEEEMWVNYRKPRPCKRGAYLFAAENNKPIISCFVEIKDTNEYDEWGFNKTAYVIHVLKPIYPNTNLSVRANSYEMKEIDYKQKIEAYEKAYGKKLDYSFNFSDIAGYIEENKTLKK